MVFLLHRYLFSEEARLKERKPTDYYGYLSASAVKCTFNAIVAGFAEDSTQVRALAVSSQLLVTFLHTVYWYAEIPLQIQCSCLTM